MKQRTGNSTAATGPILKSPSSFKIVPNEAENNDNAEQLENKRSNAAIRSASTQKTRQPNKNLLVVNFMKKDININEQLKLYRDALN